MKDMKMFTYLARVKKFQSDFEEFLIEQLPRSENSNVNALVNLRSSINSEYGRTILVEMLDHLSIMDIEDVYSTKKTDRTLMDPIM